MSKKRKKKRPKQLTRAQEKYSAKAYRDAQQSEILALSMGGRAGSNSLAHTAKDYRHLGRVEDAKRVESSSSKLREREGPVLELYKELPLELLKRAIERYKETGHSFEARILRGYLGEKSGLEHTSGIASIFLLTASIIFLSPNITGNIISNLSQQTSTLLGIILFIIGLILAFNYFRKS